MISMLILTFIVTNVSSGNTPYNTTMNPNPAYFPNLITQNYPWFFPFITMVMFIIVDYVLSAKTQIGSMHSLMGTSLAFMMISYGEVTGGLMNSVYFFTFEFIFILIFFITALFEKR